MLAPHIDHLFDSGMISFTNEGDLLVSKQLSAEILSQWGIMCPLNVGPFSPDQCGFLEYHRTAVFRQ
jgi:hypothetical protein